MYFEAMLVRIGGLDGDDARCATGGQVCDRWARVRLSTDAIAASRLQILALVPPYQCISRSGPCRLVQRGSKDWHIVAALVASDSAWEEAIRLYVRMFPGRTGYH